MRDNLVGAGDSYRSKPLSGILVQFQPAQDNLLTIRVPLLSAQLLPLVERRTVISLLKNLLGNASSSATSDRIPVVFHPKPFAYTKVIIINILESDDGMF